MRPVVVSQPGVLVPADVAAVIAPTLVRELSRARRMGVYVDPDVRETIERLEVLGAGWAKRRNVPTLPLVDGPRSDDFESITVNQAATRLRVSDTAIKGRLRRGTLRGMKVGGRWRVDARAVEAEAQCP